MRKTSNGLLPSPLGTRDFWEGFGGTIFEQSTSAMIAVDPEGNIVHSNALAKIRLGLFPTKNLAKTHPGLWHKTQSTFKKESSGERHDIELAGVAYAAEFFSIHIQGNFAGGVCCLTAKNESDEMLKLIDSLRGQSWELDAIINSTSDGLWVCDADSFVIHINPAAEKIHSIRAEEVIGRSMYDLVDEGFIDRSAVLEVIESKTTVSLLQRSGNKKLRSTGTPVFDDSGELVRVVISTQDLTDMENLQRELEEQEAIKNQFRIQLQEIHQTDLETNNIIAKSSCMINAFRQALKASQVDSSVLVLGESGVGKGLFAELIHGNSGRSDKPLITVNCGSIPDSLVESELFGYEKGAFTGAAGSKPGIFELADGGTLFLDEIAELPSASQVKLLRFLEDGKIMRLGSTTHKVVDVRIVAATHRDLESMVRSEKFRFDLYYRLNVIPIRIPPLRERRECLFPLIRHYIDYFAKKNSTPKTLSSSVSDALLAYSYPGNVRELMNICERIVAMSENSLIDVADLPSRVLQETETDTSLGVVWTRGYSLKHLMEDYEKKILSQAWQELPRQNEMASVLGMSEATLTRKLQRYKIKKP